MRFVAQLGSLVFRRRYRQFRSAVALVPIPRQLNREYGAPARSTVDVNGAVMIADNGLHDRKSQSRTVLLGRVIGSEKALGFFRRDASPGITHLQSYAIICPSGCGQS